MNAERLLALYERVAEAPDAIARLRRFILDLAVRGKLVAQDPQDEPASELLKRIAKEKARLVKAGEITRDKPLPQLTDANRAFELPSGWNWARLGDLSKIVTSGSRDWAKHYSNEGAIFVRMGNLSKDHYRLRLDHIQRVKAPSDGEGTRTRLESGDILISITGDVGMLGLIPEGFGEAYINQHTAMVRPIAEMNGRYVAELFRSPFAQGQFNEPQRGIKNSFRLTDVTQFVVPLPPLAEQHRIVAKVDELMALCDRLEAARQEREARRDRLAAASLARLNAPDPETFQSDARFALDALPALTTRPNQIKQLRQTILNLAVRGKLVPQDPQDEPASELLKRIAQEKARLVKAGAITRDKPLPQLTDADIVLELPRGWKWVRLGQLTTMVTSGSRDWAKHYSNEGAIFVRMGNLSKDHYRLRLDHIQRVKAPSDGEGTRTRLESGDILISITGDVGMLGLIPEGFGESYINQHTAMVRPIAEMKGRYLAELFRSPFAQRQFNEPQRGIKNSFRLTDVTQFVVPLPPLAEQHRIVAKVDELMALCDRLEASLTTSDQTRTRLLEATLAEAFAPASISEMEAAE
jgi:type I restriction enzyme S subunit